MLKVRCLRNIRLQLLFIIIVFIPIFLICHKKLLQRFPSTINIDRIHSNETLYGFNNFNRTGSSSFPSEEANRSTKIDSVKGDSSDHLDGHNDFIEIESNMIPSKNSRNSTKVILLYTTLFGNRKWTSMDKDLHDVNCPVQNCQITYDKKEIKRADVVIFHGVDLMWNPGSRPNELLSISRPSWQRWVFFMHEPPIKNLKDYSIYNGIFNWTASYRRISDIFVPYFSYERITTKQDKSVGKNYDYKTEQKKDNHRNYAEGKTGVVAWAVSHCGLIREQFVLELEKYINVTVYGKCSHRFKQPGYKCNHRTDNCHKTLTRYKFYLSFESCFCDDYVTEKYWENAIQVNTVPVVLGPSYDSKIVIPGSYIDVFKFRSIEELANYLKYLDKNDTAYNKYFEWKKIYRMVNFNPVCAFCQKLHEQSPHGRVYHNIGRFWSIAEQCGPFKEKENKLRNLIKQSETAVHA